MKGLRGQFLFIVLILLTGAALMASGYVEKGSPRKKLIKFSHKFHLQEEIGASCDACHSNVFESKKATDNNLPTMDACSNCHDVEDESNCKQCHISEEVMEPFPNPPRKISFNHKFHLENQKLECTVCHQGLDKVDYATPANLPKMETCATCHNDQKAKRTCSECHAPDFVLLPDDHQVDWRHQHALEARVSTERCQMCHTQSDCQECHQGAPLISGAKGKGRFGPYLPSLNSQKGQISQRVHDLNYRYTHGMDAKGKVADCQACHDVARFCTDCHLQENVLNGKKPVWHGGPGWGAIAGWVGTGGGRHAELAKRDMETCMACHDVEGNDPTCLLCHRDPDGVKGTDPRTHEAGFADRFGEGNGPHDDSSICFACHVNTHQPGVGFCGYCHGAK